MQYTIGTGTYRCGAGYSELKHLLQDGYDLLKRHGLTGERLRDGARLYAKVFRQYYQQCGLHRLNESLENELTGRVLAELQLDSRQMTRSMGLTRREFNFGITLYDPRMSGLEPFIPAILPDPEPHRALGIPEEYVEHPSSWINDDGVFPNTNTNCALTPETMPKED